MYLCGNNIFIIGSIKASRKCVNREAEGEEKLPEKSVQDFLIKLDIEP